jgi:hypothetical protein
MRRPTKTQSTRSFVDGVAGALTGKTLMQSALSCRSQRHQRPRFIQCREGLLIAMLACRRK